MVGGLCNSMRYDTLASLLLYQFNFWSNKNKHCIQNRNKKHKNKNMQRFSTTSFIWLYYCLDFRVCISLIWLWFFRCLNVRNACINTFRELVSILYDMLYVFFHSFLPFFISFKPVIVFYPLFGLFQFILHSILSVNVCWCSVFFFFLLFYP